jgi:serine phosphatase RsbU (regulator of sigma subunit)/tetratricopeptide (TPR) repeat protein
MKRLVLFIILIKSLNVIGQFIDNQYIEPSDTLKGIWLNQLAHKEFNNNEFDRAIEHAELSIVAINESENPAIYADNLLLLADIYKKKHNNEKVINYYIRAASIYEKYKNENNLKHVYQLIANYYMVQNAFSKALEYFEKALNMEEGNGLTILLKNIGICYYQLNQYKQAHDYFYQHYKRLPQADLEQKIDALAYLSMSCLMQKEYFLCLNYDMKILEFYKQKHDQQGTFLAYNNIGYDYIRLKDYNLAVNSFKEALLLCDEKNFDIKTQVNLLLNVGICYQNINEHENAITYLKRAYKLVYNKSDYINLQADIEHILATVYFYNEDYYNAELFGRRAIFSAQSNNNRELLQSCYFIYSQILKAGNDFIKALDYYEMHLALKDSLEKEKALMNQTKMQNILELEKTEKELKLKIADEEIRDMELKRMKLEAEKKEKELDLLRKQHELEVSEKERIMQSLILTRQQHDAEIKEKELKTLEQEKAIKDLQLRQKEAEKKEKEKEITLLQLETEKQSEARKRAIYTAFLTGVIGLLILISLLIARKKNVMLAQQKKEIEEKNRALEQKNEEITTQTEQIIAQKQIIEQKNIAITDSILYASRIQDAVLPPKEELQQYFTDSFIFFKPLNIVSGDFYWGTFKRNQILIAAADCTGHGVPGAFMSMLGCAFLNEIIMKADSIDAAYILNELRKYVIKALRQKGETGETQDGMDIALCLIDNKNKIMHFAGANNPLYFIRNNELNIIKGDRMPIGIHMNSNIPFTNHVIEVNENDHYYIFSDGFADQFGGPENKKFKYNQLQQLLLNIHEKPFSEQQQIIEKAFNEWKGENDQTDDILVIGFQK